MFHGKDLNTLKVENTAELKSYVMGKGVRLVGVAGMHGLGDIPSGLEFDREALFAGYPHAVVLGVPYGQTGSNPGGRESNLFLETVTTDLQDYIESRSAQFLVVHPEDEYDPLKRMGFLSLKVLARQAGIGWQGKSLLIVSPEYGPVHRFIAILTNLPLMDDVPMASRCGSCTDCIDLCPRNALKTAEYDDHPRSREDVLSIESCLGDEGCLVCLIRCPHFRPFHRTGSDEKDLKGFAKS